MKGVILAGGYGTRLYPLTRITNKHLLPLYDKPMIYFPIETLVEAGITELMVVTGGNSAGDFLRLLGNGRDFGLPHLNYAYQERAGGIAEAIGLVEHFVDGDKFVVMLGDNIVAESLRPYLERFQHQAFGARVLIKEVQHPEAYGVPVLENGTILRIDEKPRYPRSRYAVTGVYMYDSTVFDVVRRLKPSDRGELEVTDVNNEYIEHGTMGYDILEGWWGDAGESIAAYCQAFSYLAQQGIGRERIEVAP